MSFIVGAIAVVLGYVFSRMKFLGKRVFFSFIIVSQVIPSCQVLTLVISSRLEVLVRLAFFPYRMSHVFEDSVIGTGNDRILD